jgi:hypothetical protein
VSVSLSADIEYRPDRPEPYRARVRWIDPATKRRKSKSQACPSEQAAPDWIEAIRWQALCDLAAALVARSADHFEGGGDVVIFAACTAARIGEVSGIRCADIDCDNWTWTIRRQTTPSPGGLIDKGTKGKRARTVPLIEEVRPLIEKRLNAVGHDFAARIFTGPRGGRITTAVLRDATHWDESSPSLAMNICAATTCATPA